jgi:hypothetical protein
MHVNSVVEKIAFGKPCFVSEVQSKKTHEEDFYAYFDSAAF